MKYLILLLLLLPLMALGQFAKGDKLIGGTLGLTSQRATDSPNGSYSRKVTNFSIMPRVGFFLNEKFALGGTFGYYLGKDEVSSSYSYSAGLLLRRYFTISENFFLSIEATPSYRRANTNYHSIGILARPVLSFFPSKNWELEAGIGRVGYTYMNDNGIDVYVFNLDVGSLNFGLNYYLRNKVE